MCVQSYIVLILKSPVTFFWDYHTEARQFVYSNQPLIVIAMSGFHFSSSVSLLGESSRAVRAVTLNAPSW